MYQCILMYKLLKVVDVCFYVWMYNFKKCNNKFVNKLKFLISFFKKNVYQYLTFKLRKCKYYLKKTRKFIQFLTIYGKK